MRTIFARNFTLQDTVPIILAVGGMVGFLAAFILTIEKIHLIQDPSFQPSCNFSPILSCGSVMEKPQAGVFGFPNSLIGVGGFAIVTTIGMALLAGARFRRWFWLGLQAGTLFGVSFVTWLQYQSIYTIGALCPYCMVVWAVMIPIFWYTTLYNLREGHIKSPAKLHKAVDFLQKHHGDILLVWFLAIIGLILHHFWYYWSTLL
jgi:uncharacterized membrane protein